MMNNHDHKWYGPVLLSLFALMMVLICTSSSLAGQAGYSSNQGSLGSYQTPQQSDGSGKKLLAVYVVGSDLESYDGAATTDFNELIKGYNALNNPGSVDIIIAFGGADQNGWRGMRFANINQLLQDGADGRYGDETGNGAYLYTAANAHMGDQSSLRQFLEYVQEGYANYDVRSFVFWDHGASYGGFGNDENYNYDLLTLTEIQNALEQSGADKFDMIGFDACLMASAEVARFVRTSATYLLASEELEPGHGWNWTSFIKEYVTQPNIEAALKNIINNFVANVHEYKSDGKTLSAVKLDNFDAMSTALDAFAQHVAANFSTSKDYKKALIHAVTNVRDYGKESRQDERVSVDLKDLVKKFRDKVKSVSARQQAYALLTQVNAYIYYARQDGSRPNSYGVAIAPVEGAVGSQTAQYMVNNGWIKLQQAYAGVQSQDTSSPVVEDYNTNASSNDYDWDDDWEDDWDDDWDDGWGWDDGWDDDWGWYYEDEYYSVIPPGQPPFLRGERSAFVSNANHLRDVAGDAGVNGVSATFSDENLSKVTTIFGFEADYGEGGARDPYFLSVAEMEAYPTTNPGEYFTPEWNKKWYTVEYDPNAPMTEWMPMVFQQRYLNDGVTYTEYAAEIDYYQAGKDYSGYDFPADFAILHIVVDQNNQVVNHYVQTYKILYSGPEDEEGRVQIDKATYQIQPGDKVQFWTYGFHMTDPERDDWFDTSDVITFTQEPTFDVELLEFEDENGDLLVYKYAMWAEDISKNGVLTDPIVPGAGGSKKSSSDDNSCFISSAAAGSIQYATPVTLLLIMFVSGGLLALVKRD